MAHSSYNDNRGSRHTGQQPRRGTTGRRPATRGSSSRRPSSATRNRNLTGPDTGYSLHSGSAGRRRRSGGRRSVSRGLDGRMVVLIAIIVIVIVVLIAGISSCVSSATSPAPQNDNTTEEEQAPRVASGISDTLTEEFNEALDRSDQLAQIAQSADKYDDDRLLELALHEPEAISFVANYLTASRSGSSYGDTVTQGEVPQLYDWDTRWGYVSYGDGCIGVTGSGPTTVAMAYMGLTGKSDTTPATIAQASSGSSSSSRSNSNSNSNSTSNSNTSSTTSTTDLNSSDTVIDLMESAGLSATAYDPSSDTLVACLSSNSVAAVHIDEDGLVDDSDDHWALVVGMNDDGSLNVFDPTSSFVSNRTWSSSDIANASTSILYVTVSETQDTGEDGTTSSDSDEDSYYYDDEEDYSSSSAATSNGSTSGNRNSSSNGNAGSNSNGSSSGNSSNSSSSSNSNANSASDAGATDSGDYIGL